MTQHTGTNHFPTGKPVSHAERTQPDTCKLRHRAQLSVRAPQPGQELRCFFSHFPHFCSMGDLTSSAKCCLFLTLAFSKYIQIHIVQDYFSLVSISHSCTDYVFNVLTGNRKVFKQGSKDIYGLGSCFIIHKLCNTACFVAQSGWIRFMADKRHSPYSHMI